MREALSRAVGVEGRGCDSSFLSFISFLFFLFFFSRALSAKLSSLPFSLKTSPFFSMEHTF